MDKKSFSYRSLPEEETINHHNIHATTTATNSMQLQELPSNYALELQEPFAESDDKAAADSTHSHRQAEKRRRDRINAQLARLRKLIPKSDKMDKAALLERVVEQVKDLKRKESEISKLLTIPTEVDYITIDECQTNNMQQGFPVTIAHDQKENHPNNNIMLMRATFCCEDRVDLIPELIQALKDLNLTLIGAEIGCLGGRVKSVLLLYYKIDTNNDGLCNVSEIKESLMGVLNRIISWSSPSTSNFRVTSKRQRFFFSS